MAGGEVVGVGVHSSGGKRTRQRRAAADSRCEPNRTDKRFASIVFVKLFNLDTFDSGRGRIATRSTKNDASLQQIQRMPVNNVVQLPIVDLHKIIESANETGKLQPLLDAIKLACQEKTNFAPIVQAWAAGKKKFNPVSFDEFALFLQEFEFELPNTETVQQSDDCEESELVKAYKTSVCEMLRRDAEIAANSEFQSREKKLCDEYGSFLPARQLAHVLPKYFKDENPGSVIGQYMAQMYARSNDDSAPNFSRYQITDKHLANTILEIGKTCLQADKSCSAKSRKKFDRALNYIVLSCEDETGFDCIKNCGPFFETIEIAPLSLSLKLLCKWGNDNCDRYHLGSLPAFGALLDRIGIAEPLDQQTERALPFLVVNLIHKRITDALWENSIAGFIADDAHFLDAIPKLVDRARVSARRNFGGRSSFTEDAACAIGSWKGFVKWNTYDLRIELARALEEAWPTSLHVWDTFDRSHPPVNSLDRCDTYMSLFDACEEEGFQHLACAVLAFFLFSQAVAHKGNLGPWCEIAKRVERAAQYPGQEMVGQALRVATAVAHESSPLTALAIRSLLTTTQVERSSNVVELSTARAAAMQSRAEFEEEWKVRLGPLRWDKLNTKCRGFLVSGDMHWSRIGIEFWKDDMDFGSMGLDYAKAIEAELGKRLEWLPASTLFMDHCKSVDFKAPEQMTLGAIVETLRGRHPLPHSLRHEIENAGVRCQDNDELMKLLKKLVALRNEAAHPTRDFGPMQYTEMMLLIRKILPAFVDSLSS